MRIQNTVMHLRWNVWKQNNAWVWLYMYETFLENAWINCSDYTRVWNMLDHLTCLTGFGRWLGFLICQGYVEFCICLNTTQYATVMPQYASICLNIPQYVWTWLNIGLSKSLYCWIFLNMSKNAWINCTIKGFSVCLIVWNI